MDIPVGTCWNLGLTCNPLLGPVVDADAVVGTVQDLLLGGSAIEDTL